MEKLPELRDLALTFLGLDMIKEPIRIAATAHYSMGGIPTDIRGQVRKDSSNMVEGFYAAGECACASVHGANRLGANSVLEAMFFGRYVGTSICEDIKNIELRECSESDAEKAIQEIESLRTNMGTEKVHTIRTELQSSMTDNAGVFRTKESLTKQLDILSNLKERFKNIRIDDKSKIYNTDLQEAIELGHMLDFSMFIVTGALARNESRGAHYREDFNKRDDEKFLKHTMSYMDSDGNIKLEYMDVTMGRFEPQERTY